VFHSFLKKTSKVLIEKIIFFALTMQPFNPNTLPCVLKNMPLASSIHCQQHQVLILKTIIIVWYLGWSFSMEGMNVNFRPTQVSTSTRHVGTY
jgi:hypothetical protein